MTDRASEFLLLFNQVTEHLRTLVGAGPECNFPHLVSQGAEMNVTIRRDQSRLLAYGKLRNAIVHGPSYPAEVIAEPTERTLTDFRTLVEKATSPTLVIPKFEREVRCFGPGDSLREALAYMRSANYSQVVVRENGGLRLLTTEGVAWWATGKGLDEQNPPGGAIVGDALRFEFAGTHQVLHRGQSIDDAKEAFATQFERGRPRLYALLITETGADTEAVLGIVTPWDLLGVENV
jgi:CBS domain-containing protein